MSVLYPKVLLISSANPFIGPGVLAIDSLSAFKDYGVECDLLTKERIMERPDIQYVIDNTSTFKYIIHKIFSKISRLFDRFTKHPLAKQKKEFSFFYKKEDNPPIPVNKVLKKIKKDYDLVIVYFWQELLSFKTIEAIYDKLHCTIIFMGVDYSHMSGGCHFTGDCENYIIGCGCCKGFESNDPNDFSHFNVNYRKAVYKKVKPIVIGNTYMHQFYDKSYLLKNYKRKEIGFPIIDSNLFFPLDSNFLRAKYDISSEVKFIIFLGSQNVDDKRKGVSYMLDALKLFYDTLNESEKKSILLIIAGKQIDKIKDRFLFNYKFVGYIPVCQLPEIYSLSNVFLSTSINDAGPMMVNQSLMCGTPVIGFEMGTMLDSVKDKGTGFCAKLKDTGDLSNNIEKMYKMVIYEPEKYSNMRNLCREFAIKTYSPKCYVEHMIMLYEKYKIE